MIEKTNVGFDKLDITKADETTLRPVVDASREALVKARQGLDRPFQVPVVYDLNDITNRLMNESAAIRGGLARALMASGRLAELEGRIRRRHLRDYSRSCAWAMQLSHHVPMMPYQVAAAVQGQGLRGIRDLRTRLGAAQCGRLIGVLQDLDRDREPVAESHRPRTSVHGLQRQEDGHAEDADVFDQRHGRGRERQWSRPPSIATRADSMPAAVSSWPTMPSASIGLSMARQAGRPERPCPVDSEIGTNPDPYSGKPLIYRRLDKTKQLYSVGPDRVDDKLDPAPRSAPRRHLQRRFHGRLALETKD